MEEMVFFSFSVSSLLLFTCLSIAAATLYILLHRSSFYLRRRGLPPGSLGLPLVGETLEMIAAYKTSDPEPFIDGRVGRFGRVFTTHLFGEPTVFSADPETNRFILQNEGRLLECSYPSSLCNLLGRHSLLLMKGGLHKRMHSLTMSFANSPIIRDHWLLHIDRLIRHHLDSWTGRVLLMEEAKKFTFELAVKQLISLDPCEWTENLRKEYVLVIEGFFTIPYFSATYRRAIKARSKVAEELHLVVRKRREERAEGAVDKKKDMLAALLDADGTDGGGFSDEEIVDFLVSLLVAGYDTTSTSITLAVKFLTDTPPALAQLQAEHEEIRARKGGSEALEWSDYKSMPFTQCVINETLRIGNIVSGIFRRTTRDIQIKGYTIPKGWRVFASFRAVHLDLGYFEDARSFNPWRWQQKNESGAAIPSGNINNLFVPFGGGNRICPGYELARVQLSLFLHHLVTRFSWVPAEEDKLIFFPTTRTQKWYPINVQRRVRTPVAVPGQAM